MRLWHDGSCLPVTGMMGISGRILRMYWMASRTRGWSSCASVKRVPSTARRRETEISHAALEEEREGGGARRTVREDHVDVGRLGEALAVAVAQDGRAARGGGGRLEGRGDGRVPGRVDARTRAAGEGRSGGAEAGHGCWVAGVRCGSGREREDDLVRAAGGEDWRERARRPSEGEDAGRRAGEWGQRHSLSACEGGQLGGTSSPGGLWRVLLELEVCGEREEEEKRARRPFSPEALPRVRSFRARSEPLFPRLRASAPWLPSHLDDVAAAGVRRAKLVLRPLHALAARSTSASLLIVTRF